MVAEEEEEEDGEITTKFLFKSLTFRVGRESSVGIPTRYGLDGPGTESRWG